MSLLSQNLPHRLSLSQLPLLLSKYLRTHSPSWQQSKRGTEKYDVEEKIREELALHR
jgi:hypothetical protein